uniref:DNA helicase MCM8 n=1 Tax=Anopheles dirus TaxID=7168 RepID=A0A182NRJ3_9DIPT
MDLYFPNNDSRSTRVIHKHVRCVEKHLHDFPQAYSPFEAARCGYFEFNVGLAKTDIYIKDEWPTFEDDLKAFPEYTIACIGLAMHRCIANCREVQQLPSVNQTRKIHPRLHYFTAATQISAIGESHVGKLVTVRGVLTAISEPWITYECQNCDKKIIVSLANDSTTQKQYRCYSCNVLRALISSKERYRKIIIKGIPQICDYASETIDVCVQEDPNGSLLPGDDVSVTGIVKISSKRPTTNVLLQAMCVRSNKNDPTNGGYSTSVTGSDLQMFRNIRSEPFPFKLLVQSLCPHVSGMESVKAGLLLALLSDSYDTHVLLAAGDSNVARTLLKSCASASSKAAFLNGESLLEIGLSVEHYDDGLQYLTAGPAALADLEVCCIDRIDKLDNLTVLEKTLNDKLVYVPDCYTQNRVEVPARITLLATASPIGGVFDNRKSFNENFPLPATFMEQLALVFLVEDTIDSDEELVCSNGVRLHPEKSSSSKCSAEMPLVRQLKLKSGEQMNLLPIEMLQKYIDYARTHCQPDFTDDSKALLENFFSQMYSMPQWLNLANGSKIAPIQNMIRARARVDLCAEISVEHVMDSIRIISRSWYDRYDTDDRVASVNLSVKKGPPKATNIRQFLDVLRARSVQQKTKSFTAKDLRGLINEMGLPGVEEEIIEKLNIQGYLLKRSSGCYELLGGSSRGRGGWRGNWRGNFRGNRHQGNVAREKPIGFALPSASVPSTPSITPSASFSTSLRNGTCEYVGWKLYFPKEEYSSGSKTVHHVRAMQKHYNELADLYDLLLVKNNCWFELKLDVCDSDTQLRSQWPSLRQDLTDNPEHALSCIGLAMHHLLMSQQSNSSQGDPKLCLQTIRPRIVGFGPEVSIGSIKVSSFGKLVSVRGTIIRAGASQIMNTWCAFRCGQCSNEQAVQQKDGIYTTPTSCHSGCKARSHFVLMQQSVFTRMEAYQTIRLQETTQGSRTVAGSAAKNIEIELTHEMVDSVCPGDDVTVTGILKARSQDPDGTAKASLYKAYMQAVYVRSNKNVLANWNRLAEFTELDMEAIRMIKAEPSPFRLLVQSLCPTIYGHEVVKAGLLLGLFGGQATTSRTRAEIHVLVVGDPGIGKSQILQSCANVSPRGIFVCGTNSSNVGLTVTVRMEKGVGASLEAGALVLADQGVCCIDEFDKMSGHHGLLEVMEQRSVSVAKAGVICTVPARTSVLAAANPAGGHYNKAKTVSENLKLHPALLSRFDLVFILLDRSDERTDNLLTTHIQKVHGLSKTHSTVAHSFFDASGNSSLEAEGEPSLEERLRLVPGEKMDLLPAELVQKYIGYARKNVQPKLTAEAAVELRDFFVELRRSHHEMDMIPVTTRQLEGLIRLTQARAKIDLSSEATVAHVRDVLAILRQSMLDVFSTDEGDLQFTRLTNGSGTSKTSVVRKFARVLASRSAVTGSTLFTTAELKQAMAAGGIAANCNEIIDTMNIQGFLLKKGRDCYKFIIE